MNLHDPTTPAPSTPAPTQPARGTLHRLLLILGVALIATAATAGIWWAFQIPTTPPEPPLPAEIHHPDIRKAIDDACAAVRAKPGSAVAWGELGMVLQVHQFYLEADRAYDEASRLDPTETRWLYGRALVAIKHNPAAAVPLLKAVGAGKTNPDLQLLALLYLGEALLEQNKPNEAAEVFEQARSRDPANARAAFGLGLVAIAHGDYSGARELLEKARASPFYRKQATIQLAHLAHAKNDPNAAELEKAVASLPEDPHWPDPFIQQLLAVRVNAAPRESDAESLERRQEFAAAAEAFLDQIKYDPSPRAYLGAGMNLARTGEYERAGQLLGEAIKLDPDNHKAHYFLSLSLKSRADAECKRFPNERAVRASAIEWYREAVTHARRATELKPDHAEAYLSWGASLKALGEPAAALIPLRLGIAVRPTDLDLNLTLAETLIELGKRDEARTTLEGCRSLNPGDPRAAEILGKLETKQP